MTALHLRHEWSSGDSRTVDTKRSEKACWNMYEREQVYRSVAGTDFIPRLKSLKQAMLGKQKKDGNRSKCRI